MKKKFLFMFLLSIVTVSNVLADNGIGTRADNGIGTFITNGIGTFVNAVVAAINGIGT